MLQGVNSLSNIIAKALTSNWLNSFKIFYWVNRSYEVCSFDGIGSIKAGSYIPMKQDEQIRLNFIYCIDFLGTFYDVFITTQQNVCSVSLNNQQ